MHLWMLIARAISKCQFGILRLSGDQLCEDQIPHSSVRSRKVESKLCTSIRRMPAYRYSTFFCLSFVSSPACLPLSLSACGLSVCFRALLVKYATGLFPSNSVRGIHTNRELSIFHRRGAGGWMQVGCTACRMQIPTGRPTSHTAAV